jgi:dGTPase
VLNKIACIPNLSKGRLYSEDEHPHVNCFLHDRDRIINSAAFRRLGYKTQVFVNHEGDHYRTRLTHSIEVAQIARNVSMALGLNPDLAETIALSHDLGHPPFGHAGEDALNLAMADFGGFDHNAQTIKIISKLEKRYASFDGLNLCWETLEGIAKHNGPLTGVNSSKKKPLHLFIENFNSNFDLALDKFPSLEAQVANHSDDIAYNNHDLEDGCRAGLIEFDELSQIELIYNALRAVEKEYGNIQKQRLIFETIRKIKQMMIKDLLQSSQERIKDLRIETLDDVRNCSDNLIDFSEEFAILNQQIKSMLHSKLYNHFKVNKMTNKAKRVVGELFHILMNDPNCLPTEWQLLISDKNNDLSKAITICDYISGMTDRFIIREYRSFFELSQNRAEIY